MPGWRYGPLFKMKRYLLHILLILLLVVPLSGQTISPEAVFFSGGNIFTREQLLGISEIRGKSTIRADELEAGCLKILDRYRRAGYYQASCSLEYRSDSLSAEVKLTLGPRFLVGSIVFEGNAYLSGVYLKGLITTNRGDVLDSAVVSRDFEAVSLAYADNGFPQAEISLEELDFEGDSLNLVFEVKENTRVLLSRIIFQGNTVTKNKTMLKLSGFKPGSPFSRDQLEKSLRRLTNSSLFSEIRSPKLLKDIQTGQQQLLIEVEEARFNSIFGAAVYNQAAADQKGWLAGSLDLNLGNIAGTARSASVLWERPQKENSRLEIDFWEPFLLGSVFSTGVSLKHMIEDSSYVKTSAGILIKMPVGEGFRAGVGAEYERIVPGSALIYQKNNKYSTKWLLEWMYFPRFPASDVISIKVQADYGRKRYYQPSQQQLTVSKVTGDLIANNSVFKKQEVYFTLKGRIAITGEKPVPRYDQFAMGGTTSLRGYYEEQFVANQVAWSNLEYRFKPVKNLMFFPYTDLGYYYDRERSLRGYRFGYGFGFKFDTKIGWINILYGLGQEDSILNGKVHFGLENAF
jgi:outer membrane protein assembly factor BamA